MVEQEEDMSGSAVFEENYLEEEAIAALLNLARHRGEEWVERVGEGPIEEVAPQIAAGLKEEVSSDIWKLAVSYFEGDEEELLAALADSLL